MRFSLTAVVAALAAIPQATATTDIDDWDVLAGKALANQVQYQYTKPQNSESNCTPLNAAIRREWGALSKRERKEYIDAVQCLIDKPSQIDPSFAPGARSRFDDFVAVHINQTMFIHGTGNFLTWHRYYTWAYEQALRSECGYKGYQPYWSWGKYADDPLNSPIFDGSEYSMSGDGSYIPHEGPEAGTGIILKPGHGGGCVTSGPFKDFTVNLGPLAVTLHIPGLKPQNGTGLEYNPRCLRRDINVDSASWTTVDHVVDLIENYTDIVAFQNRMQGDFATGYLGIHGGGHYTISGDPAGDFFASPGDPAFYLHHAAIDRVFWTWQNLDPDDRTLVVGGSTVLSGDADAPDATLDDMQYFNVLAPDRTIRELLDTTGGPFCYVYL
ncbi:tyrosinase family protein [Aspergillus lucknowensis]|uniref:Tyrosinase copper-binding domain-containing protein n=1 Tax=Aspergillus lucknowensis TaxID=176173 RepID=A0ABR4LE59_9EURO